jgi:hypothetical protein
VAVILQPDPENTLLANRAQPDDVPVLVRDSGKSIKWWAAQRRGRNCRSSLPLKQDTAGLLFSLPVLRFFSRFQLCVPQHTVRPSQDYNAGDGQTFQ